MGQNKHIGIKNNFSDALSGVGRIFHKKSSVKLWGRQYVIEPVKTAVILIVLIVAVSAAAANISVLMTGAVETGIESGSVYSTKVYGGDILMYNNRGVKAINPKGKVKWEISKELSQPVLDTDGSYILLADLAGNHYAAKYKKGKMQTEFKVENDIITAKVTKSGYVAIATDTDGYKGKVTVYSKRGKEIYTWNSGSGYITDVDLTDNGRYLAVAQLITDGSTADTKIQLIDTSKGDILGTAERKGEVTAGLKYVSSGKLVAVTDSHILGYNNRGRELFNISLAGKSPSLYSLDGDKCIAVVTMDNRGNSVLEMYSMNGKLCGEYTASGDIRAISVNGKSVLLTQQRGVTRVSIKGREKCVRKPEQDVKSIGLFGDEARAVVIGSSIAETIRVR